MIPTEITALVGTLCAVSGAIAGALGFRRLARKDTADQGKSDGALRTDIEYIKAGIDELRRRDDRREGQHIDVITRLTAVESSAKQAHKRLDNIESKGAQNHGA